MDVPGQEKPLEDAITGLDAGESRVQLENELIQHRQHLRELPQDCAQKDRARVELDIAGVLLGLGKQAEARDLARQTFDVFVAAECWADAVQACDLIYGCEQDDAIVALGNGVWLAVTYPVPPELTVNLLHHIVDETPDDSDGGAVAAVAAHYIADMRAEGKQHENLIFLTSQIVARVAKRHRGIQDEESIRMWIEIHELNDPGELLSSLATVLDAIVADEWWIDRDELRSRLPVQ
ncbi:MAG: hypothetical protein U9R74_15870 [Pseudomonadota bacterium]|nr:hypothetical protein [Pseudomonadota bacterium]